jgi:hypothetical protein
MARRATEITEQDALELLSGIQAQLDADTKLRITRIEEARAFGVSWARIGDALGMTAEGARQILHRARTRE